MQTGLLGTKEALVPVAGAQFSDRGLTVPYTKDTVKNAPHIDIDQDDLPPEQEDRLYQHYGLTSPQPSRGAGSPATGVTSAQPAATTTGSPVRGRVDETITRRKEQLHVGTEVQEVGKARLRRYVVSEQQSFTVPLTHE